MSQYSIEQVVRALEESWSVESRYPKVKWDSKNPARGQCAVSALVAQDYLGGDLKRYSVVVNGNEEKHFVNVIPSGKIVDTTRSQYVNDIVMVESPPNLKELNSIREKLLKDDNTRARYRILGARVAKRLAISEMESRSK